MSKRARRSATRKLGALLAGALLLAACGSQHSYEELLAGEAAGSRTPAESAQQQGSATGIDSGTGVISEVPSASDLTLGPTADSATGGPAGGTTGDTAGGTQAAAGQGPAQCTQSLAPIVIGSVGTQSGLVGSTLGTSVQAVQAWVADVNSRGGIKCHPVRYTVADDGGDPSKHQALVQRMVEQDKVVAFVQMNSVLTATASEAYLSQRRIPVIGSEGGSNTFHKFDNYFPAGVSGDTTAKAVFAIAAARAKAGNLKIAALNCIEFSVCSSIYDYVPQYAREYGVEVVYRGQGSLVQPDFTSACQAAKDAGAQMMVMFFEGNGTQRIARSCKSVGFNPQYVIMSLAMSPALAGDPNLEGLLGGVINAPWMATDLPAVAEFQQVLRRYAPGVAPGPAPMQGWASAKLFEAGLLLADDPTTSPGILAGMWKIKENDLGGLIQPVSFAQGQTVSTQFCAWSVEIRGGKYVSGGATPTICGPGV